MVSKVSKWESGNFDPEKSFSEGAKKVLETNKITAELKARIEEENQNLLDNISKARIEAEKSGDNRKLTQLLAELCAKAKVEINKQAVA